MWPLLHAIQLTCLVLLLAWGLHRLVLLAGYWRSRARRAAREVEALPDSWPRVPESWPRVLVQLPLYNERDVAAEAIRALGALDYPPERFEVQVLDDSDDGTVQICAEEVARLKERGVGARHVRRPARAGFKAGALAHGLELSDAERVAIFDADFRPGQDFLKRAVARLEASGGALVQARWDHSNRDESCLTRAQGALLDAHFAVEHQARWAQGLFFNFNGTAGLWRRSAIEAGGGWQADTLTEDLDLSYRAQLAGERFTYADDLGAPAELPSDVAAFKAQQARWARGSAQVARKLLGRLWRAPLPLRIKLEATTHLIGNVGYPLMLLLALLAPLSVVDPAARNAAWPLLLFAGCMASLSAFYATALAARGRSLGQAAAEVPLAIALGLGLSVSQSAAVFLGLAGRAGEFRRTPKKGERASSSYRSKAALSAGIELLLAGWLLFALGLALQRGLWTPLPLFTLFALSFGWVGALSLRDRRATRGSSVRSAPDAEARTAA
jgi:cellulose synthase/poly-beta-1,6-N-acetylglucosamine synthase-like glycosyltransferase